MELFINGGHMGQYSNEGAMNAESKKIMESIWDNGFVKNKYENK